MEFTLDLGSVGGPTPFLDVLVYKQDEAWHTTVFCKQTDNHSYLPWDSNHPQQIVCNIPYGVGLRVRKLCSLDSECDRVLVAFYRFFLRRGYPSESTRGALRAAFHTSRDWLLQRRPPRAAPPGVPFTVQWDPAFRGLGSYLRSLHWHMVE